MCESREHPAYFEKEELRRLLVCSLTVSLLDVIMILTVSEEIYLESFMSQFPRTDPWPQY